MITDTITRELTAEEKVRSMAQLMGVELLNTSAWDRSEHGPFATGFINFQAKCAYYDYRWASDMPLFKTWADALRALTS